jgi:hypothetical protein
MQELRIRVSVGELELIVQALRRFVSRKKAEVRATQARKAGYDVKINERKASIANTLCEELAQLLEEEKARGRLTRRA